LHGALKAPLEEYQDSGDIWKLLGKLNDTYKQLDARNEYEDTTSEMFVGSLVKWRADYEQKLAEQNRTKTFREQELKKAREVIGNACPPSVSFCTITVHHFAATRLCLMQTYPTTQM